MTYKDPSTARLSDDQIASSLRRSAGGRGNMTAGERDVLREAARRLVPRRYMLTITNGAVTIEAQS